MKVSKANAIYVVLTSTIVKLFERRPAIRYSNIKTINGYVVILLQHMLFYNIMRS